MATMIIIKLEKSSITRVLCEDLTQAKDDSTYPRTDGERFRRQSRFECRTKRRQKLHEKEILAVKGFRISPLLIRYHRHQAQIPDLTSFLFASLEFIEYSLPRNGAKFSAIKQY